MKNHVIKKIIYYNSCFHLYKKKMRKLVKITSFKKISSKQSYLYKKNIKNRKNNLFLKFCSKS